MAALSNDESYVPSVDKLEEQRDFAVVSYPEAISSIKMGAEFDLQNL
jgi:hypothetical protein